MNEILTIVSSILGLVSVAFGIVINVINKSKEFYKTYIEIENKINIFLDKPLIPAALLSLPLSVFLLFLKTTASNKPLKKSILINTISAIIKLSNPPKRYEKKDPSVPTMNKALYLYFIIIIL